MRHPHLILPVITFTLVSLWIAVSPLFGVFDSLTHWGAVQVFLRGGDPYDFRAMRELLGHMMRNVPESQRVGGHPWTITFMVPFYAWPFSISKFLLAFTNLSLYYLCIQRLRRLWPPLPRFSHLIMWAYIPLSTTLYFGQFSVFLLLGTVLLIEWLHRVDRPWWMWSIAMALLAIKPQGFIVATPFLVLAFVKSSSLRDKVRAIGFFVALVLLTLPALAYLPQWVTSNHFSHNLRTATLSTYARDVGAILGHESPLWLWSLPIAAIAALTTLRVRISGATSLLLVLLISQLTAPYIWVYDSCALMPLFYALIGAITTMNAPRWRRHLGVVFTSVAIFPAYLAIDSDFSFMAMHNVCLAIATLLLLPGLRGYLKH